MPCIVEVVMHVTMKTSIFINIASYCTKKMSLGLEIIIYDTSKMPFDVAVAIYVIQGKLEYYLLLKHLVYYNSNI